tara:strand:+ start:4095 stop:4544 length:450 start_codon:yes stop_codon:yes gene_type:complete
VLLVLPLGRILLLISSLFLVNCLVATIGLLGVDLVVLILGLALAFNLIGFLLDVILVLTGSLVVPTGKANCFLVSSFLALVFAIVNLSAFIIAGFVCFPNFLIIADLTVGLQNVLFQTNHAKLVGSQPDKIIQSVKLISLLVDDLPIDC